ncbi:MAG: trypsin-like peptidase domain-containing protein [Acidimicrobiia bacterium]|nr:trypsin-like peptidase domain-containing protein [Acidimicrobiia bacterium]
MTQHVFDHRVVALRGLSNRRSGAHEVGSGYVVAPGLVLTCRHVLDNIEGLIEFRAIGDTQWSEASRQVTIGGLDANGWITQQRHPLGGGSPDVALLKIGTGTSDLESAASAGAVQPVKWGKVVLDEPVTPTGDGVRALGFPIERIKEAGRPMARPPGSTLLRSML